MYSNLRAEIARKNIPLATLAEAVGCTIPTMSLKISDKAPISFEEAVAIKKCIGIDMPLEELFAREGMS